MLLNKVKQVELLKSNVINEDLFIFRKGEIYGEFEEILLKGKQNRVSCGPLKPWDVSLHGWAGCMSQLGKCAGKVRKSVKRSLRKRNSELVSIHDILPPNLLLICVWSDAVSEMHFSCRLPDRRDQQSLFIPMHCPSPAHVHCGVNANKR